MVRTVRETGFAPHSIYPRLPLFPPRLQRLAACGAGVLGIVVAHVLVELKLRPNGQALITDLEVQVHRLA